jgi:hypothetical protein
MRTWTSFAAGALLSAVAGCATPTEVSGDCAVTSLKEVIQKPLAYEGKWFCGEVLVARPDRVIRVMSLPEEVSSYGTVLLARSSDLLGQIPAEPTAYYMEASIWPQTQCFEPAHLRSSECVPWARPVHLHIRSAQRLP